MRFGSLCWHANLDTWLTFAMKHKKKFESDEFNMRLLLMKKSLKPSDLNIMGCHPVKEFNIFF